MVRVRHELAAGRIRSIVPTGGEDQAIPIPVPGSAVKRVPEQTGCTMTCMMTAGRQAGVVDLVDLAELDDPRLPDGRPGVPHRLEELLLPGDVQVGLDGPRNRALELFVIG